ncbi:MAG: GNAT family N-acetyltransferase, partial [Microbacteriaceae bacterium]|nr:GNAT family N-acetyltransferase [Microbacteriaceae bacterium]
MVTDGATFARLCNVFINPHVRGQGAGAALIAGIVEDCRPLGLRCIALLTDDAHGVYPKFGFARLDVSGTLMKRLDKPSSWVPETHPSTRGISSAPTVRSRWVAGIAETRR